MSVEHAVDSSIQPPLLRPSRSTASDQIHRASRLAFCRHVRGHVSSGLASSVVTNSAIDCSDNRVYVWRCRREHHKHATVIGKLSYGLGFHRGLECVQRSQQNTPLSRSRQSQCSSLCRDDRTYTAADAGCFLGRQRSTSANTGGEGLTADRGQQNRLACEHF